MNEIDEDRARLSGARSLLSFRPIGEPIELAEIEDAYRRMAREYGKPVTADAMARVGAKSGSHLLKLISPRADGDQSVMRPASQTANQHSDMVPSVNAADIPVAKIAFRPMELLGHPTKSLVGHILNPDSVSDCITGGFAAVFGSDVLNALKFSLLADAAPITRLPAAEFPIIFLPNPAGGDLQATPVAPAAAYMGMRAVTASYFRKQEKGASKVPRGSWSRQAVSAKPQNISGAIGGLRTRFHARFPGTLNRLDAEIRRFVSSGSFPRMPGVDIADWILRYANLLDREAEYSNRDIRSGLDRLADRLILEVFDFIDEILAEAIRVDSAAGDLPTPPPGVVLLRRYWVQDGFDRARRALADQHFLSRLKAAEDGA